MRKIFLAVLVIFLIPAFSFAGFKHYKLKNGLNVYIEENHALPIVNITILYKVGCVDEYNSITGISHMLEHMNFRGSKHFPDGYIDRLTSRYGGINNAQTSFDYTVYFATIQKKALKDVLGFFADNMNNLLLEKSKFLKERSVVYQERLWRIDNSADGFLYFTLHNMAYKASPYRWTPIGFAYDIQHYTIDELRSYYEKYYAPNNAVLVVSGDLNTTKTIAMIKKLFRDKKPKRIVRRITKEPAQNGRRIAYISKPSQFRKIAVGFKIPSVYSHDTPVLDLISYILFDGKTALAYNDLVRDKKIFADIDGGNEERVWDKGLFEIFGDIEKGISFKQARESILKELNKIKSGRFDPRLLEMAKQKAKMDYLLSEETLRSKDMNKAFYAAFGLDDYYENYLKIIDKITIKDVERVAEKYFIEEHETDVYLVPSKGKIFNNPKFKGSLR
ncbi:M16 family metallopeptidase [Hippea alviniae]|uniref:M16 family metallopeptidase n=1 Tax=Hippea alviniae TaxID=1279027 RepID=UPI0003B70875|nr:pitrilysin family protein [Hippea alviniae]